MNSPMVVEKRDQSTFVLAIKEIDRVVIEVFETVAKMDFD